MMDNIREKLVEFVHDARMNALWHNAQKPDEYIVDMLMANGVTVQEWIPVRSRLPEKGEEVLVFDTREDWIGFAWLHPDETWTVLGFDFPFDLGEVTHWMPLPTPPKGE